MPQDIAGRKVLNRYKIIEKIGGGGMSVVWKAYDLVLDRNVALKILRPEMSEDEDFIKRFRREAQSVASLSHPNIVNVYDVGEDQGLYFIVMELIGKGETLRDYLKSKGRLGVQESLEIASQICEALSHAHAKRIIHRDIKPQNILLAGHLSVRVADFGIARALGAMSTTTRDMVIGSAPYISPEQAKNGLVSTKSDLYSLGVVLYEMLAGKQPFAGDSPVAVALQHVEANAPSLRENAPSIPQAVDELVQKAMAKDPQQRFQSADEMLAAIRALEAGAPQPAAREATGEATAAVDRGDADLARGHNKRKPLSLAVKIFLGIAAVTLLTVAYALFAFNSWISVPEIEVPDVVGKSQVEAQAILNEAGFFVSISGDRYDSTVPAGTVLSQSPLGGEKAKKGRDVWCFLSKGPDFATVPDVVGKVYPREVEVLFRNAGVQMGDVAHTANATMAKGQVISQKVPPGLGVPKDTPVGLVVSSGPEVIVTKVPPLTGLKDADVEGVLGKALLDLGVIMYQPSSTAAPGTVISQDPAAGTEVPLRTKVNVFVAEEPPTISHTYTKAFSPKDVCVDGKPARVVISVSDARQKDNVVYDRTVLPTDLTQTVTFEWQGSQATVKTNIGGKISTETIRP